MYTKALVLAMMHACAALFAQGRHISFRQALVVLTCNVGSSVSFHAAAGGGLSSALAHGQDTE